MSRSTAKSTKATSESPVESAEQQLSDAAQSALGVESDNLTKFIEQAKAAYVMSRLQEVVIELADLKASLPADDSGSVSTDNPDSAS